MLPHDWLLSQRLLQFSSGAAAGGLFLGGGGGGGDSNDSAMGNSTSSSSSGDGSGDDEENNMMNAQLALGILGAVVLLGGIFATVGVTWCLSYLADYYCCCFPGFRTLRDSTAQRDTSTLARRARLYGLTLLERQQILQEYVFAKEVTYEKNNSKATEESNQDSATKNDSCNSASQQQNQASDASHDANQKNEQKAEVPSGGEIESSPKDMDPLQTNPAVTPSGITGDDVEQQSTKMGLGDTQVSPGTGDAATTQSPSSPPQDDPLDDADHERLCCICLAEYKRGDRLLRGETCGHLFHWQCCMEWLTVPHDHCPYCRQGLVSVASFRQGAIACLGIKRVQEMGSGMAVEMTSIPATAPSSTPSPGVVDTSVSLPTSSEAPSSASSQVIPPMAEEP